MKLSISQKFYIKFSHKKRLLILGDSHTSVFDDAIFRKAISNRYQLFIETVGGATISGLVNPNSKTNAQAIFESAFCKIKPDVLITQMGEVDTGFVIWYRAQKHKSSVEEMLELCVNNYCDFLKKYQGNQKTIVLSAPQPTIRDNQDWGEIANLRKEISASQQERTKLTLAFNSKMEENARALGVNFINLDTESIGDDGLVAPFLLNDDNNDHHYAQEPYLALIMKHLGNLLIEK
ncbi:SGNH/GDSL hydrolase family protein [Glaciecola sp. SC05]|uniref:SGNH/GDSL hydrolase family protein n=1 Tax=Glaciecola sp. SC05 TaxID=1987355 RepID=UPI003529BF2F